MDDLLVSVCIPTYNGERYLREALDSVEAQTYRPLEIIISDDHSSDNTVATVDAFVKTSTLPVYLYSNAQSGIGANWNNCVKRANGQYVKWLFQDDLLFPECIEKMMAHVIKNSQEGNALRFVFSRREIIGVSTDYVDLSPFWDQFGDIVIGSDLLSRKDFYKNPRNRIGEPSCVMMHKSIIEEVGYFDTVLKQSVDYEYWYRALKRYNFGFVNESLVCFRLHDKQATQVNATKSLKDVIRLPWLFFKNLKWHLHPKVVLSVIGNIFYGFYRYLLIHPFKKLKK